MDNKTKTQDADLLDRLEQLAQAASPDNAWPFNVNAFRNLLTPQNTLKLIAMARRSIPQGDEPAKAAAQGDELPPMPWDDSEANRANKITVSVGDLSDAMREYGAACRAGRAKGE